MKLIHIILMLGGIIVMLLASFIEINIAPKYNPNIESNEFAEYSDEVNNQTSSDATTYNVFMILSATLSALGIAVFVGSLTSLLQKSNVAKDEYIKNIEEIYKQKVSPLIENSLFALINNPNTIKSMNAESREQLAITSITQDNIFDDYKTKVIHQITSEFKEYRMSGYIVGEAYIEDGRVFLDVLISYKKCKIPPYDFEPEQTFVDKNETSYIEYIKFSDPNDSGNYDNIPPKSGNKSLDKEQTPAFGSSFEYVNTEKVSNKFKDLNEVFVEKKIKFKGFNHWIDFGWMNACPTLGFSVSITCKDNLRIKEYVIIDASNIYAIPPSEKNDNFNMSTTQWIASNTGFVLTISVDEPATPTSNVDVDNETNNQSEQG